MSWFGFNACCGLIKLLYRPVTLTPTSIFRYCHSLRIRPGIVSLIEPQLIDTASPEYFCIEGFISINYIVRVTILVLTLVFLSVVFALYVSYLFSVFIENSECRSFCF